MGTDRAVALSEADSRSPYHHRQVQWSVFEQRENILHKRAVETNSMLMAPTLVYVKAAIVNPFTDN
jgi:hypothetical protein